MRRAVFLDRDGVLNRALVRDGKPYPPGSLSELEVMPGAAIALASLQNLGFLLVVVTNQPDVGRGSERRETVEAINKHLQKTLLLDDFFVCYHTDDDRCNCRKPEPGLFLLAQAKHAIDLASSYMIGDRWRDIEAGERAGCATVLIDYGYVEPNPRMGPAVRVRSLDEATGWIVDKEAAS